MTRRPFDQLPRPTQAGILCDQDEFRAFLAARFDHPAERPAAEFVRAHCGIDSRRALATNAWAARIFDTLRTEFDAWRGKIGTPDHHQPKERINP